VDKPKIIVVGASHGGHQSVLELLHRYPDAEITMFESGDFVSFMSCGMELFLEDQVTDVNDVRNFRPDDLIKRGAHVFNNHEVRPSTLMSKPLLSATRRTARHRIILTTN